LRRERKSSDSKTGIETDVAVQNRRNTLYGP